MAISEPSLESLKVQGDSVGWPRVWASWFTEVFLALRGWRKTYYATLSKTWGAINGATESTQTVTVTGARSGDNVVVTPATKTAGIIESGVVTATDTVTVYAQNTTAGAITPGAKTYKIVVLQQ